VFVFTFGTGNINNCHLTTLKAPNLVIIIIMEVIRTHW
jgi:hypothetical protein